MKHVDGIKWEIHVQGYFPPRPFFLKQKSGMCQKLSKMSENAKVYNPAVLVFHVSHSGSAFKVTTARILFPSMSSFWLYSLQSGVWTIVLNSQHLEQYCTWDYHIYIYIFWSRAVKVEQSLWASPHQWPLSLQRLLLHDCTLYNSNLIEKDENSAVANSQCSPVVICIIFFIKQWTCINNNLFHKAPHKADMLLTDLYQWSLHSDTGLSCIRLSCKALRRSRRDPHLSCEHHVQLVLQLTSADDGATSV